MKRAPAVSVIIPTYNRKASVLRTLNSLRQQTLAPDRYEVIVVDDGSTDDTPAIANHQFPFSLKYLRQKNQGATVARNNGVQQSRGEVLVFIDDDVTVSPQTLLTLAETCMQKPNVIVMGTLVPRSNGQTSIYGQLALASAAWQHHITDDRYLHFVECNTELLSVKRSDFFNLGMLQDPTHGRGWPNWDDVDFGYRAHLRGYRLLQSATAVGEHWDYSLSDWTTACRRWQRACKSAVWLFQAHPGLQPHLPMLWDKTPIAWSQDPPGLIVRKVARYLASSRPVLGGLEQLVSTLEKYHPSPALLRPLYRWISGGYMFQGYREGLRACKSVGDGI